jgi:hypothetical protein
MDGTETNLTQRPVDRLIGTLCHTIAAQRDQIRALEALATSRGDDWASMGVVCTRALTALHDEQEAHARLRVRYERVVIENRELRGRSTQMMERAA